MLFTVIELVKQGYPDVMPAAGEVRKCVRMTESRLRAEYAENRTRMLQRLAEFEAFLSASGHWWHSGRQYEQTRALLDQFATSLCANYSGDSRSYQLLDDETHRSERRQAIVDALLTYNHDRECWERVLQKLA